MNCRTHVPRLRLSLRQRHTQFLGVTTLVVLHDLNLAAQYCDKLIMLDQGHVAATGTPDDVLEPDLIQQVYSDRHQIAGRLHLSLTMQPEQALSQKGVRL